MIKLTAASLLLQICASLGEIYQHTSLMQVQSLAVNSASANRQATLTQFQTFADQLVREHKAGDTMEDAIKEAIQVILAYIDQMYQELWEYHRADYNASKCPEVDKCEETYLGGDAHHNKFQKLSAELNESREKHLKCRAQLNTLCEGYNYDNIFPDAWGGSSTSGLIQTRFPIMSPPNQEAARAALFGACDINADVCASLDPTKEACAQYDEYRKKSSSQPKWEESKKCMKSTGSSGLEEKYIDAEETFDDGKEKLVAMESCLTDTHSWFKPLYDKYWACKCRECTCKELPYTCLDQQNTFELGACRLEQYKDLKCNAVIDCQNDALATCYSDRTMCDTINNNVLGRKVDNETGERIKCLLEALSGDDSLSAGALLSCTNATHDTSIWNIDCDKRSCPVLPDDCAVQGVPCDDDFKTQEYQGFSDFSASATENHEKQIGRCSECGDGLPGLHIGSRASCTTLTLPS